MNWGWGIVIVFGAFICMMLYFFLRAMSVDLNMVKADYYQEETDINSSSKKKQNYLSLGDAILVEINESRQVLKMGFPTRVDSGTVWVYRPSSSKLDQKFGLPELPDSTINLKVRPLNPGFWRVKLSWYEKGKGYIAEESVQVK